MRTEDNNDCLGVAAPGNQSTVLSALFRLNAKPLHSMTNQYLTVPKSCSHRQWLD
jgi:hypothetical protein